MKKIAIFSIFSLLLIVPKMVSGLTEVSFLTDDVEFILEIVIAIISFVAAFVAFQVRKQVKGGQLEKSFNALVISTIFFSILEIYQVLKSVVIKVSGLGDIIELVIVIFLVIGFVKAKQALQ
ncbi:MAG: hypothetical protein GPJ54_14825 [Candidatus Heimdallarchaeota archaeon]|nr:hypothetical protein [Candidatus Heimdallarchaeota archaeon]